MEAIRTTARRTEQFLDVVHPRTLQQERTDRPSSDVPDVPQLAAQVLLDVPEELAAALVRRTGATDDVEHGEDGLGGGRRLQPGRDRRAGRLQKVHEDARQGRVFAVRDADCVAVPAGLCDVLALARAEEAVDEAPEQDQAAVTNRPSSNVLAKYENRNLSAIDARAPTLPI